MAHLAVSDLHGNLDLWRQIEQFVKPDDFLVVLGDCIDRGPQPFLTLKAVYESKACQIVLLCGNHEFMFANALVDLTRKDENEEALLGYLSNGGMATIKQWIDDGSDFNWVQRIDDLPYLATYDNKQGTHIVLTHSGNLPIDEDNITSREADLILWDRDICGKRKRNTWEGPENTIVVHGHTPIPYLRPKEIIRPFWYAQGHRVDIDAGSYYSDMCLLFDLDTFDYTPFYSDDSLLNLNLN